MNWTVELIPVPVTDVARAKAFYSEQVGFKVDFDYPLTDDARFVQLTPPGSGCSLALGEWIVEMQPGDLRGVVLVVADLHQARAELVERGVEVTDFHIFDRGSFRPRAEDESLDMVGFDFFSDPDGNRWAVQQISARQSGHAEVDAAPTG